MPPSARANRRRSSVHQCTIFKPACRSIEHTAARSYLQLISVRSFSPSRKDITEPIPWDAATTPAELTAALRERAAQTRTALAAEFFAHARANRLPAVNLGEWAAALAPASARDASRPLSRHELLEHLASRRYDDPSWSVALEAMPTETLLREISRQLAVGLILDWERYLLEERRGALSAARLAIAVEASRTLPGAFPTGVN